MRMSAGAFPGGFTGATGPIRTVLSWPRRVYPPAWFRRGLYDSRTFLRDVTGAFEVRTAFAWEQSDPRRYIFTVQESVNVDWHALKWQICMQAEAPAAIKLRLNQMEALCHEYSPE